MKLSLVVLQGKPEGKEIPIRLSQFLIGRDPECHLRPSSPLVSKRHAALLIREGKAFVRDFGSTNGTFINKQPVKGEAELKDGDELTIGPLSFRVKLSATAQETPKPAAVAPAEKAAAAAKPAAAAKKTEAKPSGKSTAVDDEESVLELLLNLEGDSSGGVGSGADPIPGGSTIMQMMAAEQPEETSAEAGEETKAPEKKEKYKPKVVDPQATANAAKAILEKYMRRPRT
jgi:pSer/pThr/pTyr-binding forkhead associated (FHA) protein